MSFCPQGSEQDQGFDADDAKTYVLLRRESYVLIFSKVFIRKYAYGFIIGCGYGKLRKVHHPLLGTCL